MKNSKLSNRSQGKPLIYPTISESTSALFQVKYNGPLLPATKIALNNIKKKYFYYVIDDILYLLNLTIAERHSVLKILYSMIISLQNNFSINFFDIWIHEIYISKIATSNKFLNIKNYQNYDSPNYITIRLLYRKKDLIKKHSSLW